jgi:hypothetical protein
MKKFNFIFFLFFSTLFAQTQLINSNHIIYDYLQYKNVLGTLKKYDNIIIPLSQKQIDRFIKNIEKTEGNKFISNYSFEENEKTVYFLDSLGIVTHSFLSEKEENILNYSDSVLTFSANPIFSIKNINKNSSNATLVTYGGLVKLNYGKNITAILEANNGYVTGNRVVAGVDKRVAQSFTFNHTKLDYFDGTRGYINYETDNLSVFAGRNEVLWGINKANSLVLGNYSQNFDFIKLDFNYKKFRYTFLHGWLVSPRTSFYIDSLVGDINRKNPKYIAANRIGFYPSDNLRLGLSQIIIYANRPVELAYLNPFLLWESAQRSQNDLDNSFLNVDFSWLINNGLQVQSTVTFDDINFDKWFSGNWNTQNNRIAWQLVANITYPYLPKNVILSVDYTQIRPFTFSHPEINQSLSYTNNGFPLGTYLDPNSIALTIELKWFINSNFLISCKYDNIKHGGNEYDEKGNLVFNNGGDYNIGTTLILSSPSPKILDGLLTKTDRINFVAKYYLSYFSNFEAFFTIEKVKFLDKKYNNNIFVLNLNYNLF